MTTFLSRWAMPTFRTKLRASRPVEAKLFDGDARFASGNFAHIARNLADTPFRNVTIELLKDEKMRSAPTHWDKDSGEETFNGGQRKILFVKDGVRVSQVDLSAKMAMPKDEHVRPRLLVAVSDFELGRNSDGRESPGKDAQSRRHVVVGWPVGRDKCKRRTGEVCATGILISASLGTLTLPVITFLRSVALASQDGQAGILRKAWIDQRQLAPDKNRAFIGLDQPCMPAISTKPGARHFLLGLR